MFGHTLLSWRIRDLRTALQHARGFENLRTKPLFLWGDSFAPVNAADARLDVPHELKQPPHAEPLGGLAVLLAALYEEDVKGVYVRGGLASYESLLESPFLHVPHDALVPGVLTIGDLPDLVSLLAPRPVRLEGLVDELNRRVTDKALTAMYKGTQASVSAEPASDAELVRWFVEQAKGK